MTIAPMTTPRGSVGSKDHDRDPEDIHIIVKEAFGEKRNRSGRRRLLLYVETEKSITQIDPMYPATMPIGYEGLFDNLSAEIEELVLRLKGYSNKYDLCGKRNFWKGKKGEDWGIIKGTACRDHFDDTKNAFGYCCYRPSCPVCGDKWAWRVGDRAKENLMGYRGAYMEEGVDFPMYDHVVFSVPRELYQHYYEMIQSTVTYPKLRIEMRKITKLAGVKASAEIFHPYRFKHEDGTTCEEKDCLKKHEVQFAPHWHLICTGFLMQSNRFYKETGWVYKKIQCVMEPWKVKNVAHYLVTHCGLMVGKQSGKIRHNTVTYSGAISPSKIRVIHRKEFVKEECDICGRQKENIVAHNCGPGKELTIDDVIRWEGPAEGWRDRRYFYLPQTLRAMKDYREFCDHG